MIAVVVVRDGQLPAGAAEAAEESGGRVVLAGTGTRVAAPELKGSATHVTVVELGAFAPDRYAAALARLLPAGAAVLLPASPDGRDLAPRLAAALGRPLLAGAVAIRELRDDAGGSHPDGPAAPAHGDVRSAAHHRVAVVRTAGRVVEEIDIRGPFVATLVPGVRGVAGAEPGAPAIETAPPPPPARDPGATRGELRIDAVVPPDPATVDLAEAARIVGGGQGLGAGAAPDEQFALLGRVGLALGASLGGTRVASDAGWIPFERQIGTTGVHVDPRLYVAFGISGATQHTSGLGTPDHVISVNLDGSCPMMGMADLAIVCDARDVLRELAARLGIGTGTGIGVGRGDASGT